MIYILDTTGDPLPFLSFLTCATQGRPASQHLANAWEEKDQRSRNFVFDVFEFVGCAF
jgi:hypothetical protein